MSNSRIYINTNTQCSEQQKQIILECRRLAFLKDAIEDFILYLTNKNNIDNEKYLQKWIEYLSVSLQYQDSKQKVQEEVINKIIEPNITYCFWADNFVDEIIEIELCEKTPSNVY